MFGLPRKLLLGFGGLLAIQLVVGGLSIVVLQRYSDALRRFLSENYRSVAYGQAMQDALERLDDAAERAMEPNADSPAVRAAAGQALADFDRNLNAEKRNITLRPHEGRAVAEVVDGWTAYSAALDSALDQYKTLDDRRAALAVLARESPRIRQGAQEIISLNLRNMVEQDGQVRQTARNAQRALYVLIAAGAALAVLFVVVLGGRILRPPRTLTDSARGLADEVPGRPSCVDTVSAPPQSDIS